MSLRREVRTSLTFQVDDPTAFVLALEVAEGVPAAVESLRVRLDGATIETRPTREDHGTRLALFEATPGILQVDYAATVIGRAEPAPVDPLDEVVYLRPSRYVQSDALTGVARSTFPGLAGWPLVRAVGDWVYDQLDYRPEASSPTGGAVETLDAGAGVCRDFAHLTAAMLRALDVPARVVAVYAPELEPMDLHAVVEALVEGRWVVVDSTRLAPRSGLVRIATGRDAADTAFETNTLADVTLLSMEIDAQADAPLSDDPDEPVELS
ncbi:transglutaminase family protein [Homoserinibacter sp. GY 40078]|uniref:transglutaminase-like domain-containing protein n=1 Tax=Homoserinibacter sp. GY 40078 TaxID=2603275 RepID=UPI0011C6F6F5|nr:transglutaminase family protein [Homoserinibacter sp. GY 40078]TXK17241.1 transglutaminase family protein [Homoserinibacter sp. GY 40078]